MDPTGLDDLLEYAATLLDVKGVYDNADFAGSIGSCSAVSFLYAAAALAGITNAGPNTLNCLANGLGEPIGLPGWNPLPTLPE